MLLRILLLCSGDAGFAVRDALFGTLAYPCTPHLNSVNIATLKSTLRGHPENDLDEILIQVSAWYESVSRSGVTLPFALVPAFVGEP